MKAKAIFADTGDSRVIAVSDIHGNLPLLKKLLKKCGYQPGQDALVIVGDFIEKGPDCLGTLRYLMELAKEEKVYVLSGNCDSFLWTASAEQMWEYTNYWQERELLWQMGTEAGISIPVKPADMEAFRQRLKELYPEEYRFLQNRPQILETESFFFAHAGLQGEDLEDQDLEYVLSVPWFPRGTEHRFSKLLVVGHYPTANYRNECINSSPYFHSGQNVLTIDGGNMIKTFGQLNGVVLDSTTGTWQWRSVREGDVFEAPHSQEEKPAQAVVIWPNNRIEKIERREYGFLCREVESGACLVIPEEFLYDWNGELHTDDMTDKLLAVAEGERVTVLRRYGDRLLIAKEDGEVGWFFL